MENRFTHGGNVYKFFSDTTEKWLDFSANINPLGMSDKVHAAIQNNIEGLVHYPDPAGTELKKALSKFNHIPEASIVLGNGAVELLYTFFHTIKPKRVLLSIPAFSEYERAAMASGTEIIYNKLRVEDAFAIHWDKLRKNFVTVDCLVLGNPNNPTGNLLDIKDFEQCLIEAKENGVFVIVDESFIDFLPDGEKYTCRQFVKQYDNILILQSMTKFYAIPGLRLGFAMTNENLAAKLDLGKDPWNVNLLAQKAGIAALNDKEYQTNTRIVVQREIAYLVAALQKIVNLIVYRPVVNFILINLSATKFSASSLQAALLKKNILIRNCDNYPGLDRNYIRIAVKSRAENMQLIEALNEIIGE